MLHLLQTKQIRFGISMHVAWVFAFALLLSSASATAQEKTSKSPGTLPPEPISQDHLDRIIQSGRLRVLYEARHSGALSAIGVMIKSFLHKAEADNLPIASVEREMLERFAREHGVQLAWIPVKQAWQLIPSLIKGQGDIIVGQGQSIAAGMVDQARFTLPWIASRQQVVVRADTTRINSLADLASRQVALKPASPAWPIVAELAADNPTLDLTAIPEQMPDEKIMARVASGQYDITIADSEFLNEYLPQHPELQIAYDVPGGEARSWAVRMDACDLQTALNQFLNKNHLEFNIARVSVDDLDRMQERKQLRLITYKSPVNYYFNGGKFRGFEYELIKKFAKARKLRVEVVLADSHAEMERMLLSGEGDIIAAALPKYSLLNGKIEFSETYDYSMPLVIGRALDQPLYDLSHLAGRRITFSAESPYRGLFEKLRSTGMDINMTIAQPGLDTGAVLKMVAKGQADLTVLDNNQFNKELAKEYRLKAHFPASNPVGHGWAVRAANTQLLTALNEFIKDTYQSEFYNALYTRYIKRPAQHGVAGSGFLPNPDQLSPYDDLVRKYADQYSFDWRLIVAQMYQESGFNPVAMSQAGAEGLMQIMPATAEGVGAGNLTDPATSIRAGVKYMSILRAQFENDLLLEDRTWFTLASYNAGFGRVKQARELAGKMGLDPDRWFGNVEQAMLALAKPFKKDGEMVRNCRCGETVVYIHEIRNLYNNYVHLTQSRQVATRAENRNVFPFDI